MKGWIIPPATEPTKTPADFERERTAKVNWLVRHGYLKSDRIKAALLKIPRENFIPWDYCQYAYEEVPLPLPGEQATISCPHSYPLFYEPLGLDKGHRFLEVGTGSGYGAAVAREVVGQEGLVVSLEIDPETLEFARTNLKRAGYDDVVLVQGDGGLGYRELSPYHRIAITAASAGIPLPLIEQLTEQGKLIGPVFDNDAQILTLLEKLDGEIRTHAICEVAYIALRSAGHTGQAR